MKDKTLLLKILYAFTTFPSVGYCVTPSIVTNTLALVGAALERPKFVVVPSPVKLSTRLSDTSKDDTLLAIICPQKTSALVGAVENNILPLLTENPSEEGETIFGFCIVPLMETNNCPGSTTLAIAPLFHVCLNSLLTPSNATVRV